MRASSYSQAVITSSTASFAQACDAQKHDMYMMCMQCNSLPTFQLDILHGQNGYTMVAAPDRLHSYKSVGQSKSYQLVVP